MDVLPASIEHNLAESCTPYRPPTYGYDGKVGRDRASRPAVGVRRIGDLHAWQLAREFKLAVYAAVRASQDGFGDFRFRSQLFDAASSGEANVEEGFHRYKAGEMLLFLSYARASIAEARARLRDGVDRGCYHSADIERALALGARAAAAIAALQRSLRSFHGPRRKK